MDVSEVWAASPTSESGPRWSDLPATVPFALLHGDGRFCILAEGPLATMESPEPETYRFARSGAVGPILPDFIGFISYEYAGQLEPLLAAPAPPTIAIPGFAFTVYRRVRVWDREAGVLYQAERRIERPIEPRPSLLRSEPFRAHKVIDSDTQAEYESKVARIRDEIARGNVYQVNLTRRETWAYEGSLLEAAERLAAADPAPRSALIVAPDFAIIGASPESFLQIREGVISTTPIKGTAARSPDPVADRAAATELLASAKNRSELAMIVDLLRNDLTRVCRVPSVRVTAFPDLESYAHVHHLTARVEGLLRPGVTLRELLEATFPGGSVTGCPKLAAMGLIRDLEGSPRDVYTGALGWFSHDLSQLDLSIVIRTAWADAHQLRFGVGGGVVWDSEPADEYRETIHKGTSLVRALSGD
jgi:anthranilate/para-aminobenzoate synthase component I